MNFLRSSTGRLARHFGLTDDQKLSASGCLGFTYQILAVLVMTAVVIFGSETANVGIGPIGMVIASIGIAACFIGSARILCAVGNSLMESARARVTSKWLAFPVNLALVLVFATAIMALPGAIIYVLAKFFPTVVLFTSWGSAIKSGMMVLTADTILGQLTGTSLLNGKTKKAAQAAPANTGDGAADQSSGTPGTTDGANRTDKTGTADGAEPADKNAKDDK